VARAPGQSSCRQLQANRSRSVSQTEDTLASVRLLTRQHEQQQDAVSSAQRYFDLASARYRTGLDPYLNVFTAQSALLTNQQTVITLRIEQIVSSVQLIEALGGGWDSARLPSEKAIGQKLRHTVWRVSTRQPAVPARAGVGYQ
jgi:outer membrane protein TolC